MPAKIIDEFSYIKSSQERYRLRHPGRHRERINQSKKIWWAKQSVEKKRSPGLKKNYSLTIDDFNKMYKSQNGLCAICRSSMKLSGTKNRTCVDHDHITNKIRDLLCSHCNFALGHVKEQKDILQSMINYLDKWSSIGR